MDSGFESPHEASSPGPMRLCGICHKPFLKDTSYNRHILYCRRAQNRPRTRVRSCRACSIAKTKCSFQSRCLRCTNKNLDCVYDTATATRRDQAADEQNNEPVFSPGSSTSGGFASTLNDLFESGGGTNTHEAPVEVDIDWDALGFAAAATDILPQSPKSNLPRFQEPFLNDEPHNRRVVGGLDANFAPENLSLTKLPWSDWDPGDEYFPALSGPTTHLSERPDSDFLARLPISDPVSQFTANVVMQMLRAFPQMMLRRETLPSFIHGHWYRPKSATELSLPEPLVNCMEIAQVFASHNLESKPFLWRTVKMEQRSLIEKQDQHQFSRDDLLAAVQSQMMYIILRVIDNSKIEQDLNLEMLVSYNVLCMSFRNLCNQPFCRDERLDLSSSWEDWVFAESRRRTVLVWLPIAQMVRIKTGVVCDTINAFRDIPLSSPKSLWEARTSSAWQSEYDVCVCPRRGWV